MHSALFAMAFPYTLLASSFPSNISNSLSLHNPTTSFFTQPYHIFLYTLQHHIHRIHIPPYNSTLPIPILIRATIHPRRANLKKLSLLNFLKQITPKC